MELDREVRADGYRGRRLDQQPVRRQVDGLARLERPRSLEVNGDAEWHAGRAAALEYLGARATAPRTSLEP